MNSKEIRQKFKDFFASKQHQVVESAPMVVKDDPTLMFTNAGMNQFKDIFLGNSPVKWSRVANSQKCLRVSGKHNDLEEVGHDTYHHTMFEMLGNWSFGDYFKKDAIDWAWELLTNEFKLPVDRLYATVFEGDKSENLELDHEAKDMWLKYLPADRVLNGNKKDNFWEMGASGPCGPCSEIHIDLRDESDREKISGRDLVNKSNPLVIEIWNLVFIQYNRKADGSLEVLPHRHVDTGMGFERLCMAMQGKKSNYDTDVFQPIIQKIAQLSGFGYGQKSETDIAMRVIADHLRAVSFAIADGQLPSNNKAGYVIRRILRRAVRYAFTFLNQKEPFMNKLVPVLTDTMGEAFPELKKQQALVEKVIYEEEAAFLKTLATGIKLLDQIIEKAKVEKSSQISGNVAFELYDTFGFPLDLTQLIAREHHLDVNQEEFDAAMGQQKDRSRSAAQIETDDWIVLIQDDQEEFVGYDYTETEVIITKYRKIKEKGKDFYQLVFNITPFYAESGGQVGDTGFIEAMGEKTMIINVKKENNQIIHLVNHLPKQTNVTYKAIVNNENRRATESNHSATHLLHQALREILGTHVEQKGSLVNPDLLRFDFSHFQKVTDEELEKVEQIVNQRIRMNIALEEHRDVPIANARQMGAMALFGEKYGDTVRVIKFDKSVELCGGTHAKSTGQLGLFKIQSESSIAAGIRRIEASTGFATERFVNNQLQLIKEASLLLKSNNIVKDIEKLLTEKALLSAKIEGFAADRVKALKSELKSKITDINGAKVIVTLVDSVSADNLKDIAYQLKGEVENLYLVLGTSLEGKAGLAVMIADNLVKERGLHAGNIIREISKEIEGGGGGQPFFATAGGKKTAGLPGALEKALNFIK